MGCAKVILFFLNFLHELSSDRARRLQKLRVIIETKEKFCFPVSFLEFHGVAWAIRSAMNALKSKSQSENDQGISVQKLIATIKPTNLAHEILTNERSALPQKSQEKWVKM